MEVDTTAIAANFERETFWEADLYSIQQNGAVEFGGGYQTVPIDPSFAFENTPSHTRSNSSTFNSGLLSIDCVDTQQGWQSIESTPPASETTKRPKMLLEPPGQRQPPRRVRKPPSGEALERRRQQNRAAQLAFRERSKKQVEEMRLELMQCNEFNQKLYSSVRELLDQTEGLKRDMEALLATQPPATFCDAAWSSRTSSFDLNTSPESSPDYQNQEEENSIIVVL